jgi:hypothetical protein
MLGNGDTVGVGKEYVDPGVRLRSDKLPMKYGIRSLVLMMVDGSASLVRPVGCCSTAMCMATSTRLSAVDGVSVDSVFEKARSLTWRLSCALNGRTKRDELEGKEVKGAVLVSRPGEVY